MANLILIPITRSVDALLKDARERAERAGGSVTGDTTAGKFQGATPLGPVSGSYRIQGDHVELTILQKPFLVGLNLIEDKLREYFT